MKIPGFEKTIFIANAYIVLNIFFVTNCKKIQTIVTLHIDKKVCLGYNKIGDKNYGEKCKSILPEK